MQYRVLIADDEKIVRIALRSMICWEDAGFSVCAVVGSAAAALEDIRNQQPHLVITDIEMPERNGLELMRQARIDGFEGEFVVLTNHQRFSYAREALQSGALDYLIKTDLSADLLQNALASVKEKLDKKYAAEQDSCTGSAQGSDVALIQSCLSSTHSENVYFPRPYVFLDVFLRSRLIGQTLQIPNETLRNIVAEAAGISAELVYALSPDRCLVMLRPEGATTHARSPEQVAGAIAQLVRLYMNTESGCVLTGSITSSDALREALMRCAQVEHMVFYRRFDTLLLEQDASSFSAEPPSFADAFCRLKASIAKNDYHQAKQFFSHYLDACYQNGAVPLLAAQNSLHLQDMILMDNSIWLESAAPPADVPAPQTPVTMDEHRTAMEQILGLIQRCRPNFMAASYRREIRQICNFIQENARSQITLNTLSQNIGMTANYISRLFKAETGLNIVQYINYVKLEGAKELLANSDRSIKAISMESGFDEPSYFNKLFGKTYGVTPTQYRALLEQYGYRIS